MRKMLLFFLLGLCTGAGAQEKERFYALDKNFEPINPDSAVYVVRIKQINDTCWQWDYYNLWGPMVKSEQYIDADANELHGISRYYNGKGFIDSTADYSHDLKDGDFVVYNDSSKIRLRYKYEQGQMVSLIDYSKTPKDTATMKADKTESEFPGGLQKWKRYLQTTLKYPERALKSEISGKVVVAFMVDTKGVVNDSYIYRSVEYSLDEEALRIIRKSGKWVPAVKEGEM